MLITERVKELFYNIRSMSSGYAELEAMEKELTSLEERLEEPLRVAVVGFMKAGKSTLMNALLKERLLITGSVETTYTVGWFRYGETPGLTVVLKDGSEIEAPIEDMEKWTARASLTHNPLLNEVSYIIIKYPNEILKKMELIDTPGLFSTYVKDSQNALDFLGMKKSVEMGRRPKQMRRHRLRRLRQMRLFMHFPSRPIKRMSSILRAFNGEGGMQSSPINALGIFSKIDVFWVNQPQEDPFELVKETVAIHKKQLAGQLYDIIPVAAKAVEAACEIDDRYWGYLVELSKTQPEELVSVMQLLSDWNEDEDGALPISLDAFREMTGALSQYGIYSICCAIRQGVERGEPLRAYLYEKSGVKHVSDVVLRHFGNRSDLIKLNYIICRLQSCFWKLKQESVSENVRLISGRILEDLQKIREGEQAFLELDLLEDYYNRRFSFEDGEDERQFLEITGEFGDSCEARLGMAEGCSIKELCKEAHKRSQHWNGIANNLGYPEALCRAAEIIGRSCEKMHFHLSALCSI